MVDDGETIWQATFREVMEETSLSVVPSSGPPFAINGLLTVTEHGWNGLGDEQDHLSFWMLTYYKGGEPIVKEPGKCFGWEWWPVVKLQTIEGCMDPMHPQYAWTPLPLWRELLKSAIGAF